ncbi:MAG: hypothetical protein AAGN15_15000 [Cyanobacteria bacterium J06581_3]
MPATNASVSYKDIADGRTIRSSTLVLAAFASMFFSRLLETVGAPAFINFIHFITIPSASLLVWTICKALDREQLVTTKAIFCGLYAFLCITALSALFNRAGIINGVLNFILQAEPFIMLATIIYLPLTKAKFERFKRWILTFGLINLSLAMLQKVAISAGVLAVTSGTHEDNVQGVFYFSGGGHVTSGTVSLIFGLYYYASVKKAPTWLRLLAVFLVLVQIIVADTKQAVLVAAIACVVLIITKAADVKTAFKYIVLAAIVGYGFYWCIYNISFFRAYTVWIRPHIYGPEGEATLLKTFALREIPTFYTSPINWLVGLGPGHTIGRIGGWMFRDYANLFNPLGATSHPVTQSIWDAWGDSYLDSSFFSPFWGWAGIWGDLGLLGVASYLSLWLIVWFKVCKDDMSRFLVLNAIVNGLVFTFMEDPGYMLTNATLLGLRWHEHRLRIA